MQMNMGTRFSGCGTTEHHFHVEGEEVSTKPVLLNVYFGSKTKNMKFGQLGNVLPSRNPIINLAEDIAMMSQMNKGREPLLGLLKRISTTMG